MSVTFTINTAARATIRRKLPWAYQCLGLNIHAALSELAADAGGQSCTVDFFTLSRLTGAGQRTVAQTIPYLVECGVVAVTKSQPGAGQAPTYTLLPIA